MTTWWMCAADSAAAGLAPLGRMEWDKQGLGFGMMDFMVFDRYVKLSYNCAITISIDRDADMKISKRSS